MIYKNSYINGQFDEDLFQDLNIQLFQCIRKFKFESNYDVLNLLEKEPKQNFFKKISLNQGHLTFSFHLYRCKAKRTGQRVEVLLK